MKKAVSRLKTQDGLMGSWACKLISLLARKPISLLLLYLVSSSYGGSSEEIEYYSPENILKFADHLYQEGDYLRAAGEYQRYLFYSRQGGSSPLWESGVRGDFRPQDTSSILYKIGLCYRQAGDTRRAISFFREVVTEYPKSRLSFAASYQIACSYFLVGQYESSIQYINQALNETGLETQDTRLNREGKREEGRGESEEGTPPPSSLLPLPLLMSSSEREQLQILAAFNYLHQRRWRDAEHILGSVAPEDENLLVLASALRASAREGISLPRKNPILAGLFSAALPGAGKMYCKQYGDGLYSLTLIGVTGLLAWDGFRENGFRSIRGWLFGSAAGVFYAGNVYGSTIAA
jgi:tetratricopeptide (TPR) repeat protein/TM2 domain-containing membrane protein YozV